MANNDLFPEERDRAESEIEEQVALRREAAKTLSSGERFTFARKRKRVITRREQLDNWKTISIDADAIVFNAGRSSEAVLRWSDIAEAELRERERVGFNFKRIQYRYIQRELLLRTNESRRIRYIDVTEFSGPWPAPDLLLDFVSARTNVRRKQPEPITRTTKPNLALVPAVISTLANVALTAFVHDPDHAKALRSAVFLWLIAAMLWAIGIYSRNEMRHQIEEPGFADPALLSA